MTELRVDYNSVDSDGRVRTRLARFGSEKVAVGDVIQTTDGEGAFCKATIVSIDTSNGAVALAIDPTTWWEKARVTFHVDPSIGDIWNGVLVTKAPRLRGTEDVRTNARLTSVK